MWPSRSGSGSSAQTCWCWAGTPSSTDVGVQASAPTYPLPPPTHTYVHPLTNQAPTLTAILAPTHMPALFRPSALWRPVGMFLGARPLGNPIVQQLSIGRDIMIVVGNGIAFGNWHLNANAYGFSIVVGQVSVCARVCA